MLCESVERFIVDLLLFKAKITGGRLARDHTAKKLFWKYIHYLGPYSLCWSGVMQQGEPGEHWERWLEQSGDVELQSSWEEVKQLVFPPASSL